jgi:hypothetical protein
MCPKAKSDRVVTHRIEFQQTEREALEMVAASITARNVSQSVNNLITPFTQCTVAGATIGLTILGLVAVVNEGVKTGFFGPNDSDAPVSPEDIPPFIFGIIPGTFAYGLRNINWGDVSNEFDKRIKSYPGINIV